MSHVWKERAQERRQTVSTGKKRKMSEEDSVRSRKLRRNEKEQEEKELERVDDKPTPVAESHNSEDNSDELPDIQL